MTARLTLEAAAARASVSRWTVSRALKSGILLGIRDNRGRWQIDADSLDAWSQDVQSTVPHIVQEVQEVQVMSDARIELSAALAKIEGLEARLTDTQAERDRLASLLEKSLESRPGGILRRLFFQR